MQNYLQKVADWARKNWPWFVIVTILVATLACATGYTSTFVSLAAITWSTGIAFGLFVLVIIWLPKSLKLLFTKFSTWNQNRRTRAQQRTRPSIWRRLWNWLIGNNGRRAAGQPWWQIGWYTLVYLIAGVILLIIVYNHGIYQDIVDKAEWFMVTALGLVFIILSGAMYIAVKKSSPYAIGWLSIKKLNTKFGYEKIADLSQGSDHRYILVLLDDDGQGNYSQSNRSVMVASPTPIPLNYTRFRVDRGLVFIQIP